MAARRRRSVRARRPRRSTRKGQVRKTRAAGRRAYMPARRRARSNPKGVLQTPAFRYAAFATGGAVLEAAVLNQTNFLKTLVPQRFARSAIFAVLTVMVGRMALKGRARENAIALGVGMVIPSVVSQVSGLNLGSGLAGVFDGPQVETSQLRRIRSSSNPHAAAMSHAASVSHRGLKSA